MIKEIKHISRPQSGDYEERFFDNESPWNSDNWSYIKFTEDDFSEWVGNFRGAFRSCAISINLKQSIILTSDYCYRLDNDKIEVIELDDQPQIIEIDVSPNGKIIGHDYYKIYDLTESIKNGTSLLSPFEMDDIHFIKWEKDNLIFTCEEFTNWSRKVELSLNSDNNEIKIINELTTNAKNT